MYTLKVADIISETDDAVTLRLKQPALKKVNYLPGQYLTLIFRINGRRYIRPYSFSSAPGADQFLEITVKRVPGGVVSNHILDKVKVGDSIEALVPLGKFIYKKEWLEEEKNVVLWGAGSGITPLFSIIKFILSNKSNNKVYLVYGNRHPDSTIFYDKIEGLKSSYKEQFEVWHFQTSLQIDPNNPYIIQGRIEAPKALSFIGKVADMNNSLHYVCGPTGLKESVKQALHASRIPDSNIFVEDFANIKNPKDFEDIITQTVAIDFNDVFDIEVTKGKSILEAGLDALIELPYSCQTGDCTLCKSKIISGSVKMIGLEITPDDLADDECLLCCAYPLSDNVKLKVERLIL